MLTRSQKLGILEHALLVCFIGLLFTSAVQMLLTQRSIPDDPYKAFYELDDDCDGIPNFQDARFDMDKHKACSISGRLQASSR